MTIQVEVYGFLASTLGASHHQLEVAGESCRVADAKQAFGEAFPQVAPAMDSIACAIGDRLVRGHEELRESDTLVLLPPVSGG